MIMEWDHPFERRLPAQPKPMALLKILSGILSGQTVELESEPVIVGRHPDCDIRVLDDTVSRRHARITQRGDGFFVEDLGSRNGTFLNGHKVTAPARLSHRDTVSISDTSVEYREDEVAESSDQVGRATVDFSDVILPPGDRASSLFETVHEIDLTPGGAPRHKRDADIRLKAVLEITRYLRSTLEPDEVLSRIVDCVAHIFPQYSRSHLFRHDATSGSLVPVVVKQPRNDATGSPTLQPVIRGLVKQVLKEGKAVLSIGVNDDQATDSSVFDDGNRSFMCAPLVGPSLRAAGILYIETHDDLHRFTHDDLEVFACMAILAGQALEQATLFGARYRAVVDNAVDGIITISDAGTIESVNAAVARLFGYAEKELLGRHVELLMTDADRESHADSFAQHLRTGMSRFVGAGHEVLAQRKDGTPFPIYLSIGPFELGGKQFYTGIVHDISERHRAEAALRRINETLEQQVRDRTESVRLLQDVAVIANQSESVEQAFRIALARVLQFRNWEAAHVIIRSRDDPQNFVDGGIWLPDENTRFRKLVAAAARSEFSPGEGVVGHAIAEASPVWETNLAAAGTSRLGTAAVACGMQSALACPVLIGSEVVAIVELFSASGVQPEGAFLEIMKHVGTQLGRVIERDRLQRQLIDAVWNQHRRLGQELHDTLGQSLTGIGMVADSLAKRLEARGQPEAEKQTELVGMIQQAKMEVRQLTKVLYPVDVDAQGLVAALEELALAIGERSQIRCEFKGDRTIQIRDNDAATHLFRIAQEAVHNAVKHAHPKRIAITLTKPRGRVTLTVRDDGPGFTGSAAPRSGGLGMRIMQYRANAIGAQLSIETAGSGGTRVRCTMKREEEHAPSDHR
jgi:PAS domain S-box-containing protein